MAKRKICVLTGTRAEYGLLYWLMKEIQNDTDLELQIVVTGMHLSPEFGLTYRVIEQDGFTINERVEMLLSSDTPVGIAKSIGLGVIGFADVFARLKPDILVLLGDRFETFAAAQAAMIAKIPIAHIHGGESTQGAIDEAFRHSITKMAHIHFTAAEPYRKRVIQLGEDPARVINAGTPGLDHLNKTILLDKNQLEEEINFKLGEPFFLVTYHPVTLSDDDPGLVFNELLAALDEFPTAKIIFTKANADTYGRVINKMIDEYVKNHKNRAKAFTSMGQQLYLSAMKHANVVIGNSSSALTEAPALQKAAINIGKRQEGRLKATSIIDVDEEKESIVNAIKKALSNEFQEKLKNVKSLYGKGNASRKIKEILKTTSLNSILLKRFYDIDFLC